jgi:hypothetical protein
MTTRFCPLRTAALLATAVFAPAASAQTHTWTGAVNGLWGNVNNWSPASLPSVNVIFPDVTNQTISLGANRSITSVTFNAPDDYTFLAGFRISPNVFNQNGAGAVIFNSELGLTFNSSLLGTGSGAIHVNGLLAALDVIVNPSGATPFAVHLNGSAIVGATSWDVRRGTLVLNKTGGTPAITPTGIGVFANQTGVIHQNAPHQIPDSAHVGTTGSGVWNMNGHAETIRGLAGTAGQVNLGGSTLTLQGRPTEFMYYGHIAGAGDVVMAGTAADIQHFNRDVGNTYTGTTTINGGILQVNNTSGSATGSGPVVINSGGTLTSFAAGFGHVSGPVTLNTGGFIRGFVTLSGLLTINGGTLAPGTSPGVMNTGDIVFTGGAVQIELGGTTPGNGSNNHDQLVVGGTITLSNTTLSVATFGSFVPAIGNQFRIVDNDGTEPIIGTFAGLPEGAVFQVGTRSLQVSYQGGTGNDVVLTTIAPVPEPGPLVMTGLMGAFALAAWRMRRQENAAGPAAAAATEAA